MNMLRTGCWFFAHSLKLLHFCVTRKNVEHARAHLEMARANTAALYFQQIHIYGTLLCCPEYDTRASLRPLSMSYLRIPSTRRESVRCHDPTHITAQTNGWWLAYSLPSVTVAGTVRFVQILRAWISKHVSITIFHFEI